MWPYMVILATRCFDLFSLSVGLGYAVVLVTVSTVKNRRMMYEQIVSSTPNGVIFQVALV